MPQKIIINWWKFKRQKNKGTIPKINTVLLLLLITKASQVLFSGTNINNNITKSKCNLIYLITIHYWSNCKPHIWLFFYIYTYIYIVLNRIQRQNIIKPLLEAIIRASQLIDWYCFKYQLRDLSHVHQESTV